MRGANFMTQLDAGGVVDTRSELGLAIHQAMQVGGIEGEEARGLNCDHRGGPAGLPQRGNFTKVVPRLKRTG